MNGYDGSVHLSVHPTLSSKVKYVDNYNLSYLYQIKFDTDDWSDLVPPADQSFHIYLMTRHFKAIINILGKT